MRAVKVNGQVYIGIDPNIDLSKTTGVVPIDLEGADEAAGTFPEERAAIRIANEGKRVFLAAEAETGLGYMVRDSDFFSQEVTTVLRDFGWTTQQ